LVTSAMRRLECGAMRSAVARPAMPEPTATTPPRCASSTAGPRCDEQVSRLFPHCYVVDRDVVD
jgi:hypothetical protein